MKRIDAIAADAGLLESEFEPWGRHKGKVDAAAALARLRDKPDGKLALVTAMNATRAGEGKTVTTIGLAQGFAKIGQLAIPVLRQPSLGPTLGLKGGGAGGARARLEPFEDINLHLNGDIHAVATAHNLLAACLDNAVFRGNRLGVERVAWRRAIDMCDRSLRRLVVPAPAKGDDDGGVGSGEPRETGFDIAAASEVMAVLALASGLDSLQERLGRMIVGWRADKTAVVASEVGCVGAMAALLRDALRPNLAQTLEETPALIHAGPFANIAHGCPSLLSIRLARKLGSMALVEAGFGSDLGAEKFLNVACRIGGLKPDAAVVVLSCRALRYHGSEGEAWRQPSLDALRGGFANARVHVENMRSFGLPVVVALNHFEGDDPAEIDAVGAFAAELGAEFAVSKAATLGGDGAVDLARAVERAANKPAGEFQATYPLEAPLRDKVEAIARKVYRADGVDWSPEAERGLAELESDGRCARLPVCVSKTPMSLSDDPERRGAPSGWRLRVRSIRASMGAGFVVAIAGKTLLMPGLPERPAAERIRVNANGQIEGLR